jgi:hypothetical protein
MLYGGSPVHFEPGMLRDCLAAPALPHSLYDNSAGKTSSIFPHACQVAVRALPEGSRTTGELNSSSLRSKSTLFSGETHLKRVRLDSCNRAGAQERHYPGASGGRTC